MPVRFRSAENEVALPGKRIEIGDAQDVDMGPPQGTCGKNETPQQLVDFPLLVRLAELLEVGIELRQFLGTAGSQRDLAARLMSFDEQVR